MQENSELYQKGYEDGFEAGIEWATAQLQEKINLAEAKHAELERKHAGIRSMVTATIGMRQGRSGQQAN